MNRRLSNDDLRELSVMAWRANKMDLAERVDALIKSQTILAVEEDIVPPYVKAASWQKRTS